MRTVTSTLLFLALCAGVARAGESDAEPAIALPGYLGLTGFQDMVDARVPSLLAVRVGLRYDLEVSEQEFRTSLRATRDREQHDVVAYAGVSALGLLDAAIRVPFRYRRDDTDLSGVASQFRARYDEGWADLDAAAKVSLAAGPIVLAPFVFGRLPEGEPDVRDLGRFEYGVAATFSLFNEYLAFHGNLAGVQIEKGTAAFRFRAGVSAVVLATDLLLLRVYGYGDGIEYEGRPSNDFDIDFGAQAIIAKIFSVELGSSVRLHDSRSIDDDLHDSLSAQGVLDRHFHDDGTWGLSLAAGILLTF